MGKWGFLDEAVVGATLQFFTLIMEALKAIWEWVARGHCVASV